MDIQVHPQVDTQMHIQVDTQMHIQGDIHHKENKSIKEVYILP